MALIGIVITLPPGSDDAIKLTSRGPVIYTQTRVGIDKRTTGDRPNDPRRKQDIRDARSRSHVPHDDGGRGAGTGGGMGREATMAG